jgi:hypothetical protein
VAVLELVSMEECIWGEQEWRLMRGPGGWDHGTSVLFGSSRQRDMDSFPEECMSADKFYVT